jgi:hypothetical protein
MRAQCLDELASGDRRLDDRRSGIGIDLDRIELRQIDQQRAVAQRRAAHAVPASAHGDLQALGARKAHGFDHVRFRADAHDQLRILLRDQTIPQHLVAQRLVLRVPFADDAAGNGGAQRLYIHVPISDDV